MTSEVGFVLFAFVLALGVLIYLLLLAHEEAKAKRQTFNRIMQASTPPKAPGLHSRRVSGWR